MTTLLGLAQTMGLTKLPLIGGEQATQGAKFRQQAARQLHRIHTGDAGTQENSQ